MHDHKGNHIESRESAAIFRIFPNYAGTARNAFGNYPLSYLELSRPTGKYVSRWLLQELNLFTRKHSIVILGNPCLPGYFFPTLNPDLGLEQFDRSHRESCGIFVANVLSADIKNANAIHFDAEPFMVLDLKPEWQNLDDYLGVMLSKYRVRAKKALASSESLTVTRHSGENLSERQYASYAILLHDTLKEKTITMNSDLGGILHRFAEHFGPRFTTFEYHKDGELIGFVSCTIEKNELTAWHLGYRAETARDLHLYQRMLLDLVALGISQKAKRIHFGRTATEMKSTLGAVPVANEYAIFIKSRLLRGIVSMYKRFFYRTKEAIIRKPFRTS